MVAACVPPRSPTLRRDYIPLSGNSALPFLAAVRVGNVLYLSGMIGVDSAGHLVTGGIQHETRRAMEIIRNVLAQNGSSLDRVIKCTVMLSDMREWAAMNEVYVTFFPTHRPARSAFGASGLARGARVEIECMAATD
ncbi:MAG: RidA family protein [Gemmatimonadaceae bacterium]